MLFCDISFVKNVTYRKLEDRPCAFSPLVHEEQLKIWACWLVLTTVNNVLQEEREVMYKIIVSQEETERNIALIREVFSLWLAI